MNPKKGGPLMGGKESETDDDDDVAAESIVRKPNRTDSLTLNVWGGPLSYVWCLRESVAPPLEG